MTKFLVKLCKVLETKCEVEVVAASEQEAIIIAEGLEIDEDGWTVPEVIEQYVSDVEKGE